MKMKATLTVLPLLLLIVLASFLPFTSEPLVVHANPDPDWLKGWSYRKSHIIHFASGAGTNYQMNITVHYGSGTDDQWNVYLNSHSQTDFDDVRFTDNDKTTLLISWREYCAPSSSARFWVKVVDDLSSSDVTIYIYYGKTGVSSLSNGEATFPDFFDDFTQDYEASPYNPDVWETVQHPIISRSESVISVKSTSRSWGALVTKSTEWVNAVNSVLRTNTSLGTFPNGGHSKGVGGKTKKSTDSSSKFTFVDVDDDWAPDRVGGSSGNGQTRFEHSMFSAYWSGYKVYEIRRQSDGACFKNIDDNEEISCTTYYTTTDEFITIHSCHESTNINVDWILLRKYVSPEPSHGSWGSEEQPNNAPNINRLAIVSGSSNVTSVNCVQEYNFMVECRDLDKIKNVKNVTIILWSSAVSEGQYSLRNGYRFEWYNSSGTWAVTERNPDSSSPYNHLNVTRSTKPTAWTSATWQNFTFSVWLSGSANSTTWTWKAYIIDGSDAQATKTMGFNVNQYLSYSISAFIINAALLIIILGTLVTITLKNRKSIKRGKKRAGIFI